MSVASGSVHCPRCGVLVPLEVHMRAVHLDDGNLWVQLYDPKPKHKCQRGA